MHFPFFRTLRARFVVTSFLMALIGIGLLSVLAGRSIYTAKREQIEQHYKDTVFAASQDLEQTLINFSSGVGSLENIRQAGDRRLSTLPGTRYAIYQADGKLLLTSDGALPEVVGEFITPEVQQALQSSPAVVTQPGENQAGEKMLILTAPIGHRGTLYGVLLLETSLQNSLAPDRRSLVLFGLASLAVVLGLSAFGYWLADSLSIPIQNVIRTAELLSQGDLDARAEVPSHPKELHSLAEAVNTMAAKMQANVLELRSFVANASHELRTPLTSVKLRVEALRAGALDDQAVTERFLEEIESEVDRLGRMVGDLLDLSRIEAGLASRERTPLDLGALAEEVCEVFRARAERMGASLNLEVEPGLPLIEGNEDQLRRVLYNLVDNAIKYTTRNGRVGVAVQASPGGDSVQLKVCDTGYGIAPEHLGHIFDRFYRVEATRPRYGPAQGSGLGLPIARSIVEMHGGKISVTSQIQKGTTFLVELPAMRGPGEK